MRREYQRRSSLLWKTVNLLTTAFLLSAVIFSTLHLAAHHDLSDDDACSFCKYSLYSHADIVSSDVYDVHPMPEGDQPPAIVHFNDFFALSTPGARAPPFVLA